MYCHVAPNEFEVNRNVGWFTTSALDEQSTGNRSSAVEKWYQCTAGMQVYIPYRQEETTLEFTLPEYSFTHFLSLWNKDVHLLHLLNKHQ